MHMENKQLTVKQVNPPKRETRKPRLRHVVCKPCWELKYCPYGPLVEYFPLIFEEEPIPLSTVKRSYASWIRAVKSGTLRNKNEIYKAIEKILCLEPKRWEWISQFRTEELRCSVYGHTCPVFFSAEPFTETKEDRRTVRASPRAVMLKVVRRDGQVCGVCRVNVPDNELEFDHLIPLARGGPTSAENLRVLCRRCNKKKTDALTGLLLEGGPFGR